MWNGGELFIFAMLDWGVAFRSLDMLYITTLNVSLFLLPAFDQLPPDLSTVFCFGSFSVVLPKIVSKMTFIFENLCCFLQRMANFSQLSQFVV